MATLPGTKRDRIFISYRRNDSGGSSGRVWDWLRIGFGRDRVFRDVGDIGAGKYRPQIDQALAVSKACIAVIGPRWADITNLNRLQDPSDLVRHELETALASGDKEEITVIPLLVENAQFEKIPINELPKSLKPLLNVWQYLSLSESGWDDDTRRLIERIATATGLPVNPELDEWMELMAGAQKGLSRVRSALAVTAAGPKSEEKALANLLHRAANADPEERPALKAAMAALADGTTLLAEQSFEQQLDASRRENLEAPLHVSCHAMDLRFVGEPLMVGHYESDPIAGAEALIDMEMVAGELSIRNQLGIYAGPRGSAAVVLIAQRSGAVVIGLGKIGDLSVGALTEAVRVGTLRYLLQILDRAEGSRLESGKVGLASLLIGQNSSNEIQIHDSVSAVVAGVLAANEQFAHAFPQARLQVELLQLVEIDLDIATTASEALRRLKKVHGANLSVERDLQVGKGCLRRRNTPQTSGYWPRLVVSKAETGTSTHDPGRTLLSGQLPSQLSFTFFGERARTEKTYQQFQNGLLKTLVDAAICNPTTNEKLSRTLFQLLVPLTIKDLLQDLDQLVVELDLPTADLPWELLWAGSQPLALSLAMVRQLQAPRFRQRVRQATSRSAYVIGNPRTDGFYTVFAGEMPKGSEGLPALEGARKEAETVQALLQQHGYGCQLSLEENGVDVINKLYQQPYRVLHIAGHGVYEQLTRQGDRRSGVVLSSGILITAAEIEAMEVVPDLVFLNCCHPGTVKREAVAFNRLAASVARQLIEMGVRAVVACGWAVDDQAAVVFAKVFYGAMLSGTPFGEAVFQARKEVHVAFPDLNTWGAYQAYGDPSYLLPMAVKRAEADAACNVAYLAMVRGDFNKAVRYLQMAVETNPNDLDAALQLGNAWTGLGNLTKTREVLEAAIRRAVDLGDQQQVGYALIALGDAMVSAGDGQTALDSYKEALRIREVLAQKDNTNIEWLMDVADCCVKLGSSISNLNNDERIKYLSRGLEILSDLKHTGMLIPERDMTSWFENELNSLPKNGLEYPPGTGSSEQAPEWPGQHR